MKHERNIKAESSAQLDLIDLVPNVKRQKVPASIRFQKRLKNQPDGCIIFIGAIDPGTIGYGRFHVSANKIVRAHKFAWEQAKGPVPDGLILKHSCHNPRCCNIGHMSLGTRAENNAEMHAAGRAKTRLKAWQVSEIVQLSGEGWTVNQLSEKFDRSELAMRKILNGRTWSKVTGIEYKPTRKGPDWKAINAAKQENREAA